MMDRGPSGRGGAARSKITSAEDKSTPEGGTALPMMRLRAAVPSPRDAPQPGEPEPEEHERAGFRDASAGHS